MHKTCDASVSQNEKRPAEQKSEEISERLESVGAGNAVCAIPGFLLSFLWCCVWILVGSGMQDDRHVPAWAWVAGLLPAALIVAAGVFGVIYSIINIRQRKAVLCLALSIIGLLLYAAMWCGVLCLLAHF